MANCKKCLFYSEEWDEMKRRTNDEIEDGKDADDNHFCEAFYPIPDGVFDGEKQCEKFLSIE